MKSRYEQDHYDNYGNELLCDPDEFFPLWVVKIQSSIENQSPEHGGNRDDTYIQSLWAVSYLVEPVKKVDY